MTTITEVFKTWEPSFYRLLTQLQPTSLPNYHKLTNALNRQKQWEEAESVCQMAIASHPEDPWLYYQYSRALLGQNKASATDAIKQALKFNPQEIWFQFQLGACLFNDQELEDAATAMQTFLAKKPEEFWGHYYLGEILLDQENWDEAIAVYKNALQRFPGNSLLEGNLNYALNIQQKGQIDVASLIHRQPKLHRSQGKTVTLGVSSDMLNFLDQTVTSDSHTLETGAGISTLVFALKQSHHTCIVPDAELVERIKEYCHKQNISTNKIDFQIGYSEAVLPDLKPAPLDLVLIDGRHAFPSPFIDWYYTVTHLKVGGIVIVDDTKIWTGAVLRDFLKQEAEWQLQAEFPQDLPNAAAFKKKQEGSHAKWWAQQPYTMQNSAQAVVV